MDPNNQTVNQQAPVAPQAASQPVVVTPQQQGLQTPQAPKSNKKLLYGVLIGLITVAIVGTAGFYMLNSSKTDKKITVAPSPTPVLEEEAPEVPEVAGVSDLDNFIVGLAQADGSLEGELTKLEKDSEF